MPAQGAPFRLDCWEAWRSELRTALTIRCAEQRLLALFSEGKLYGTVHTCIGQELSGVAVARQLRPADYVFSNHRCHGHFIAARDNVEGLIGEIMGKANGVCQGRGGSQHLCQAGFFSNGVQGGIVPVAAGLAFAHKLRRHQAIAVGFIGDGTLGEGVLYESLNLAAKWELPLLIVLENNHYAQSTAQKQTLAGEIEARFEAFGIQTARASTWDWERLFAVAAEQVQAVRTTGRPHLLRVDTDRLMAHSKGDDNRPVEEVDRYRERDPLTAVLREQDAVPWLAALVAEATQRVERAVALAEASPYPTLTLEEEAPRPVRWQAASDSPREKVVAAVRNALRDGLAGYPEMLLLGEDIESPYGGAFKATAGLSDEFPGRVRNTPISEAASVGVGAGLALAGYRPVVEIMFGDFVTLAMDQWLNHAAKFAQMYAGQVQVPLVVRTPMGGQRGYGPTHSQSLERLFLGCPGTRVLYLHQFYSPRRLYEAVFAQLDRPTLVVENKILYGSQVQSAPPPGYTLETTDAVYPWTRLRPAAAPDLTLVALGGTCLDVPTAMRRLFEEAELVVEALFPTQLYPLDLAPVHESVARTRRLLVVEEGQGFAGGASEILAQLAEQGGLERARCRRLAAWPVAIPSARPLEAQCLPNADAIVAAGCELCHG
ncbi:MAG: pyruvate dehydrogenase [Verrucomicrobia bacterium]|nr:pyruvate dehydrogenase [Verrucomicrobiota bacterium]